MIRTILSPGFELKETDRSQYTTDLATTPRALVMGFSSQGPVQATTDITSMTDFRTIYGTPTNEVERYFYNAADYLIGAGATVVAAKIPYQGDNAYTAIKYTVNKAQAQRDIDDLSVEDYIESFARHTSNPYGREMSESLSSSDTIDPAVYAAFAKTDPTITDFVTVRADAAIALDNEDVADLDSNYRDKIGDKAFLIVDKSRGVYKTFTGNGSNIDCIGILPVVTTAANAMAIADEISTVKMNSTDPSAITTMNLFEPLDNIAYINNLDMTTREFDINTNEISGYWSVGPKTYKDSNTLESLSKIASQFFPAVTYSSSASNNANPESGILPFDRNYFSYIGVVVFKVGVERGSGCLYAEPVEAFAGSLLKNAKDIRTNGSTFIENVINTTSKYISIYIADDIADNIDNEVIPVGALLYAKPADGCILGIPPKTVKEHTIKGTTITDTMDKVFKSQSNILGSTLDVVVDAGLSTIAECVNNDGEVAANDLEILKEKRGSEKRTGPWTGWRNVVNKMKQFCETTRKDCVFIIDSPRFLSLRNNRKVVNPYDMSSTVADEILPKIKMISGINSSYGWGYVPWFNIGDASDGISFWCPPSILGANRYIITRTRWNTWDAPAGMTRGPISVVDTSFEPDLNARNVIYSNGWNYAVTDVQNGVTTLEGQKTFQSYQSAFDRINVRSLFLDLERRVFRIARNYIYEPNTAEVRQRFVDDIDPIFASTKSLGGCYDYMIIADETINTPQTIDNNEFHVRIGVQPTKTIEFVLVEFVASRTGSDWSELIQG